NYGGDASQPLHCSYLHHGQLPMIEVAGQNREYPVAHGSDEFKSYSKTAPAKVHGIYEEGMLEIEPAALLQGIDARLGRGLIAGAAPIPNGHAAARAID